MYNFNYPSDKWELKEQARYKIRLAQHAEDAGYDTIEEYVALSRWRYVILSAGDQPQHWADEYDLLGPDDEEDETNWCVYETREKAERERHYLMEDGDHGNRVVTERYFLKMKGLI